MLKLMAGGAMAAFLLAGCATAQTPDPHQWTVQPSWVSAHERFLAGPELQGRGSATRDEAIAAAYMATQFEGFGLTPAPGMDSYLQTAGVTRIQSGGQARLTAGDATVAEGEGLFLLRSGGRNASGVLSVAAGDPANLPSDGVVLVSDPGSASTGAWMAAAASKGVDLLVFRETPAMTRRFAANGGKPPAAVGLTGKVGDGGARQAVVLSAAAFDRLAGMAGARATLDLGPVVRTETVTTNAIGWLQGRDPEAGVLLVTAHLDHLGVAADGSVRYGANDDASGVTAVLELARAMAAAGGHRRSIMFVGYGSEELGLLGSEYFAEHPPIPLSQIVANLEIEMIGQQDPNMPAGIMMMTGFDRSNFGAEMKARGALIAPDIYPEQRFFERSDNYALALQGIVAHTVSGWATIPSYHTTDDTIANLNLPFMTAAIQSLVEPLRWLADSDFRPEWTATGRPVRD